MMMDLFLKSDSEADMIEALPFARTDDDWVVATHEYALDIIGTIYNDNAVFDADGEVITPATAKDGFHANLRCTPEIAATVDPAVILDPAPVTPVREFAQSRKGIYERRRNPTHRRRRRKKSNRKRI